jgi:tight adherence protein B
MTALTWRPAAWRRVAEQRRSARRDAQLPEALERLAAATRAGHSISTALAEVAATAPLPLHTELAVAATAIGRGTPVEVAVRGWAAAATPSGDLELAATALALGARAGGEGGRALDRVAATLRERRELRGEARALATQARASAGVLTVAPIAFALLVSAIEPGVIGFLVTTPAGLACLLIGLALDGLGALWMARIVAGAV